LSQKQGEKERRWFSSHSWGWPSL